MGGFEARTLVLVEPSLGYHPLNIDRLTSGSGYQRTVLGGQFDWGGRLLKGNGGAQRFVQHGRKSCIECKRINEPNCEADGPSSNESWS